MSSYIMSARKTQRLLKSITKTMAPDRRLSSSTAGLWTARRGKSRQRHCWTRDIASSRTTEEVSADPASPPAATTTTRLRAILTLC
jgi:hypothetical protein